MQDPHSRRVIGWALNCTPEGDLALVALVMAHRSRLSATGWRQRKTSRKPPHGSWSTYINNYMLIYPKRSTISRAEREESSELLVPKLVP